VPGLTGLGSWVADSKRRKFSLPIAHKPYMVLPRGGTGPFSCANCAFIFKKGDEHHCSNRDYQSFAGTTLLVAEDGKTPLDDPSRACSDFFRPAR
jgi:hypothetical protein